MAAAAERTAANLWRAAAKKVLVARKAGFGLPTACPSCLPVFIYLRMSGVPFDISVDYCNPNADFIPYVEFGECVAFENEEGGVIEYLKAEKIADLNSACPSLSHSECRYMKDIVMTWLADALQYELWMPSNKERAYHIYFSGLPWFMGKILDWKRARDVQRALGITKLNAADKKKEIYRKATAAYDALSMKLGNQGFLFGTRPTDVDAHFLGHALFVLNVLPDTSVLQSIMKKHDNLIKYAENLKSQYLGSVSSSSKELTDKPSSSEELTDKPSSLEELTDKPSSSEELTDKPPSSEELTDKPSS